LGSPIVWRATLGADGVVILQTGVKAVLVPVPPGWP